MVPEDISDAIARGDRQAVKAWLNAEDSDVNALSVYGQSPLGTCMLAAEGVIAAGSYKKYLRLPLQDTLNLLSLAQRGKLATTDPVMKSLVGVDNHVVWNVLTYWAES